MNIDSDVNKAICLPACEGWTVWCLLSSIFLYIAFFFFFPTPRWCLVLDCVPAVTGWEAGMHPGPAGRRLIHLKAQFRVPSHPKGEMSSHSWTWGMSKYLERIHAGTGKCHTYHYTIMPLRDGPLNPQASIHRDHCITWHRSFLAVNYKFTWFHWQCIM